MDDWNEYHRAKRGPIRARPASHGHWWPPFEERRGHPTKGDDYGPDGRRRHRYNARGRGEWMPRPFAIRTTVPKKRADPKTLYVQLLPAPHGTWQWCRVDLDKPFARGFTSGEQARRWLARAVAAGVVPAVVELEPAADGGDDAAH